MEKFYDLTDFNVVRSDNSETYCVLEKYFASGDEALAFSVEIQNEITKSIKEGRAKYYGVHNYYPYVCGFLPTVNFKLPSCAGYDEEGNYEEEGGLDFEMSCCILDCKTYPNGRFEITLYYAALPEDLDETNTKEIEIVGFDF